MTYSSRQRFKGWCVKALENAKAHRDTATKLYSLGLYASSLKHESRADDLELRVVGLVRRVGDPGLPLPSYVFD